MKTAIAIFVKTPGLSPVKTRLASGIGDEKALEFYRLSIAAISETLKEMHANFFFAVGEKEGLSGWPNAIYTGEGCLGQRQFNIYSGLLKNHDRVLLLGADAPQISKDILNKAIKARDFVVGGATDGGYYLFAGGHEVPLDVWRNTPWSSDKTLQVFENLLPILQVFLI